MDYSQTRSFNLGLAKELSIEAALVYDELAFWAGKNKSGIVYKTLDELADRLPVKPMTMRRSIDLLVKAGYIEKSVKKANGFPTMHFRILKKLGFVQNEQNDLSKMNKTMDLSKMNKSITATTHSNYTVWFQELNAVLNGSPRTLPTPARLKKLAARLKSFEYSDLAKAAFNLSKNDFMMGKNDNHVRYGDIDFLLRNDENVDKWLERSPVPQKRMVNIDGVMMESPF